MPHNTQQLNYQSPGQWIVICGCCVGVGVKSNPLIVLWFHCFSAQLREGGNGFLLRIVWIFGVNSLWWCMRTGQVEGAGYAMLRVLSTPGLQLSVITLGSPGHRDLPGNFLQSQDSESLTASGDTVTSDHDQRPGGYAGVLHNTPLLRRNRVWTNTEQRITNE